MNKKLTIPATARSRNRESQKFFHRKIDTSIPSLEEAVLMQKQVKKKQKWRMERRKIKLQETYDQNCRLFISIQKQKSSYALPKLKTSLTTKSNLSRFVPKKCSFNSGDVSRKNNTTQMKKYFFKKNNEPLESSQYRVNVRDILNERKKDENEPVSIFKREKSL